MLCLKKVYNDELLQFTLILSLLRVYPDSYFDTDPYISVNSYDLGNGTSWQHYSPRISRFPYIHSKNLDNVLLNYEREVFADINSLGRYNRINTIVNLNITAYLLNVDCDSNCNRNSTEHSSANDSIPEESNVEEAAGTESSNSEINTASVIELTQEDMDLIEILWKQDVDLGYSLEIANGKPLKSPENGDVKKSPPDATVGSAIPNDDIEKLKTLEALNNNSLKTEENSSDADVLGDIWAGLSYTIDTETGEYILKGGLNNNNPVAECDSPLPLGDLPLPEYFLEEALQFVGLNDDSQDIINTKESDSSVEKTTIPDCSSSEVPSSLFRSSSEAVDFIGSKDFDSDGELLSDMIQTAQFHHPSSRAFQSRMPFVRTMSIEQRWQDLANLLSIPPPADASTMAHHPFSHHHPALHNYNHPHGSSISYGHDSARSVLLHNATLNPPVGEINGTGPYTNIGGGTNLGSAVATSMNLANSTEPMVEPNGGHYKIDTPHDMLYCANPTSEVNQTAEGFLSSILNDEDLQLMDLAMNEGMYTMRILDGSNNSSNLNTMIIGNNGSTAMGRLETEKMDTSSDSALSSMGSERVPSLSDGEWCDGASDSGHTPGDHYIVDYQSSKYRLYDYSYNNRQQISSAENTDRTRVTPVAQKKHQMFGKRYFQEQNTSNVAQHASMPIKYEYSNTSSVPSFNTQPRHVEGVTGSKTAEVKYSCTVEFARHLHSARPSVEHVQHNHTYHLPAESTGAMQRPISRDKMKSRKVEEEHLSRDEKRARALNVPLSVHDIINLPMDEFNERLSKYDLNEAQLTLIRDIRRRGKNKVAAQNCRKRKLDQILSLADEVRDMRDRKHCLITERDFMISERQRIKDKFAQLYRHIFENLRDPDGNHYSPYQYSLQQSADGSVILVPRANASLPEQEHKEPHQNCKK